MTGPVRWAGRLAILATAGVIAVCVHRFSVGPAFLAALWTAVVVSLALAGWFLSTRWCPDVPWTLRGLQVGTAFLTLAALYVSWAGLVGLATASGQVIVLGALLGWSADSSRIRFAPLCAPQPWLMASFFGGLAAFGVMSLNVARYTAVGSDDMWYHLPMVAEWTRSGSIAPLQSVPLIARAYPGFRESVMVFLSLPVGHEHLAIPGMLEVLLFCVGIYALLRYGLGAPAPLAAAAGAYAVTAPQIQASLNGNDLILGCGFVLALLFGKLALDAHARGQQQGWGYAVFTGAALGIMAATKFSGPFWAGLAAAAVAWWAWSSRQLLGSGAVIRLATLALLTALVIAGPWYARNLWLFGNPLYPATVSIAGIPVFRGSLDPHALAGMTLGWHIAPMMATRRFFVQAFGWGLPALLVAMPLGLVFRAHRRQVGLLLVTAICAFVMFLHQPFNMPSVGYDYNMRYLLPWFACVVVCGAGWMRGRGADAAALILMVGAVHNLSQWTRWWPYATAVAVTASIGALVWPRVRTSMFFRGPFSVSPWLVAGLVVACASPAVVALDRLKSGLQYSNDYGYRDLPSSHGWGEVARFVHQHVRNARVLVTGDNRVFPLYGDRFENRVSLMLGDGLILPATPTPDAVDAAVTSTAADVVVCLNPLVGVEGQGNYAFAPSVGKSLLERFPGRYRTALTVDGAYVFTVSR